MLPPGTRLGPYVVHALIGRGGMGEVYRGHDTRLKRDVALKLLPRLLADDPDRLLRFEREAQILASLNHPHIAGIHGIEDADGTRTLVMELVDGATLAERLAEGPIPIDESLLMARQIAEALEAAHEAGIIHRDLKPANVKVRPDGTVKVLDFGLAKAVAPAVQAASPGSSPTLASPAMTQPGIILGSAAYMSPEQARGKPVDRRADIWAFGCVLYEMLSGVAAFPGDNISDVIAAVVRSDPDWNALPAGTPARVRQLLSRCLEKDPKQRLRDIGDARLELEPGDDAVRIDRPSAAQAVPRASWTTLVVAALAVLSVGIAVGVLFGRTRTTLIPVAATRLAITFPDGAGMHLGMPRPSIAVSPDGRNVVYTASGGPEGVQLWLRDLNQFAPTPIAGTRDARMATFSPDGRWIAFFADDKLKKVPVTTGPPVVLCEASSALGATWTSKDEIVFSLGLSEREDTGLWSIAAAGGQRRKVASGRLWFPDALPDGETVVVTTNNRAASTTSDLTIAAVDLRSGQLKPLFDGGTDARYVRTGHLLYLRNGALMATRFDLATKTVSDERVSVVSGVYLDPSIVGGNYAVSAAGTLAYVPGDGSHFRRTLMTAGPSGLRPLIDERRYYNGARASPDGKRIAVLLRAWKDDVWTIDVDRGTFTRITTGNQSALNAPVWSPDGRHVVFSRFNDDGSVNLFRALSDGSGPEEQLATGAFAQTPNSFSPDGRTLVFTERRPDTANDLLLLSLEDRKVRPLLATRFNESAAAVSPNGGLIAFQSGRSGQSEVYVAPFPSMNPPVQVSSDGGNDPVWSSDGRRLYYNRARFEAAIQAVDVSAGAPITLSRPRTVGEYSMAGRVFDVLPDDRLLFVAGTGYGGSTRELHIILNWFEELKQRVREGAK